jgi:predicted transglutaminase-like cysteine proteinase
MKYLKHFPLFIVLMVILTSCAKKPEVEIPVPEEPVVTVPGMISDELIEKAEKKYGVFAGNRYKAYNAKLLELQEASTAEKLEAINDFFNKVTHGDDIDVWGQNDYWATPLEFLGRDKGDCEDYVIAKYFALRDLGIASEKLYFAYVKSLRFKTDHMVLSYFETPTSVPLVLDNTNFKIFPADQRKDLVPVYNFNMGTLYRAGRLGKNGHRIFMKAPPHEKWEQLIDAIKRGRL